MPSARTATDSWSEVWDAYEARQAARAGSPAPLPPETVAPPAPARRRGWLPVVLGLGLGALGLSGPARPLLDMAGLMLWPDVPALLERLDLGSGLAAPPLAIRPRSASSPSMAESLEAERYLTELAVAVAEGWRDPTALRRVVLARQDLPALRGAVLQPLETVRHLQPLGWGQVRVEIGPVQGAGGLGLDLAWQAGGWRVTRLQLLDPAGNPA